MQAFRAIVVRDFVLAFRSGASMLTLVIFYLSIGIVLPIAIGPDNEVLSRLAPAIIWVGALLSLLLGLDRLFVADQEDGTLMSMHHASISFVAISFAKLIVHWLVTAFPLILATPFLAVMLSMDLPDLVRTLVALTLGTPALTALGAFGASVSVSLKRGGVLAPILILPLSIPVVIFGVSAIQPSPGSEASLSAFLFLSAFSLLSFALIPFAIALALHAAEE